MADLDTTSATVTAGLPPAADATATPAPAASEQGQTPADAATPGATESEAAVSLEEVRAAFDRLPNDQREQLVKDHPWMQGKIGNLTQQQAARLIDERVARERAAWERQMIAQRAAEDEQRRQRRLERLAEQDPDQFSAAWRAEQAERKAQHQHQGEYERWKHETGAMYRAEMLGAFRDPGVRALVDDLSDEQVYELFDPARPVDQGGAKGFAEYLQRFGAQVKTKAEKAAAAQIEAEVKARAEAMRRDQQADRFAEEGAEPVNLGLNGGAAGGMTLDRLTMMPSEQRRKFIKDHPAAYDQILARATG